MKLNLKILVRINENYFENFVLSNDNKVGSGICSETLDPDPNNRRPDPQLCLLEKG